MSKGTTSKAGRVGSRRRPTGASDAWYRYNRSVRCYGIVLLAGTKLADAVTTAVGLRCLPSITEANPVAGHLFAEWGLFTGLALLGFASVFFAVCSAELFGLELRRRFGLPKTALYAQASIYLSLSLLFGTVALRNGLLIADRAVYESGVAVGCGV